MDNNKKNRQETLEPRTASSNKETKDKDVWRKRGTYTYPDGTAYVGEFNEDGVKDGTGTLMERRHEERQRHPNLF